MSKYSINIHCLAITTDIERGKIFILSTDDKDIIFPVLNVNKDNVADINLALVEYMKNFLMTNNLELVPQIISINSSILSDGKKQTINMISAFLLKENIKNFNSHWIDFDFRTSTSKYNPLLLEVIQKLQ